MLCIMRSGFWRTSPSGMGRTRIDTSASSVFHWGNSIVLRNFGIHPEAPNLAKGFERHSPICFESTVYAKGLKIAVFISITSVG